MPRSESTPGTAVPDAQAGSGARGSAAPAGRRRGPGRGPWAAALVVVVLVAALAWAVTRSPVFELGTLRVTGARHLTVAEVRRIGELSGRTNVLWFSPAAVEARLEANPWVLRADVSRILPSTIYVTIVERRPVAVAGFPQPMLVAADGTVLGPASSRVGLPALAGERARLRAGQRLPSGLPTLRAVAALPRALLASVRSASVASGGAVDLVLRDGVLVKLGSPDQLVEKGRVLQGVLAWARRHGIVPIYVTVAAPDAPALLPPGASSSPASVPVPSGSRSGGGGSGPSPSPSPSPSATG